MGRSTKIYPEEEMRAAYLAGVGILRLRRHYHCGARTLTRILHSVDRAARRAVRQAKRADQFWAKVDQSGGPDACWPWTGWRNAKGYGRYHWQGKETPAHRLACELAGRPIPADRFGCHHCDNPPCCNPAHIFPGTPLENVADMLNKGRGILRVVPKLTPAQIQAIPARYAQGGVTYQALADEYGCTRQRIHQIIRRSKQRAALAA